MRNKPVKNRKKNHKTQPADKPLDGEKTAGDLISGESIPPGDSTAVFPCEDAARILYPGGGRNDSLQPIISDIQSEEDVTQPVLTYQKKECDTSLAHLPEEKAVEPAEYLAPSAEAEAPAPDAAPNGANLEEPEPTEPATGSDLSAKSILLELFVVMSSAALVFGGLAAFYLLMTFGYSQSQPEVRSTAAPPDTTARTLPPTTTTHSTTTSTSTTTTTLPLCPRPYIQVGGDCCLDGNANRICDRDESEESTTTTHGYVLCRSDLDCGPTRVEYACLGGGVHKVTVTSYCVNPGSPGSRCERNLLDEPVDECGPGEHCVFGRPSCAASNTESNFDY